MSTLSLLRTSQEPAPTTPKGVALAGCRYVGIAKRCSYDWLV